MSSPESETGVKTISKEKARLKHPKQYKVVLLNDDFTPMDFVVSILETIFQKSPSEAVRIMLQVHQNGRGVCGLFSKQIAEAKVALVHERAREAAHPLQSIIEDG